MPRIHLFAVVVLLGAAAVAGLLAVTRTVALGSPEPASSNQDAAISFRLQRLDRLEATLRKELASQAAAPASVTVQRRATTLATRVDDDDEDADDEHEDGSSESSHDEDRDD